MSQKDVANAVGVTRQTINAIENGDYNPTVNLCIAICKVLGKTLNDIFWEEDVNCGSLHQIRESRIEAKESNLLAALAHASRHPANALRDAFLIRKTVLISIVLFYLSKYSIIIYISVFLLEKVGTNLLYVSINTKKPEECINVQFYLRLQRGSTPENT